MKTQKHFCKRNLSVLLLSLLLCGSLLFSGCSRIALFVLDQMIDEEQTTPGTSENIVSQEPIHRDNPREILNRAEESSSEYGSAATESLAISDVVRLVQDTVVEIYTANGSAGSGVIISDNGYVLTCNHVVEGASSVVVMLKNEKQYNAQLVGADSKTDLAVLKINPGTDEPLIAAEHGVSANLVVGETVVAIGNPLGTLGGTVTHGIISATARQVSFSNNDGTTTVMTLLQTDAAINSGNSGGGLFNMKGQLIGIVNAKYASTGVEGLGFAIPIDSAYTVECDLIEFGYVRGIIDHGLSMIDITPYNLARYSYNYGLEDTGIYVLSSKYNSELINKDRIISVNGVRVDTIEEFETAIQGVKIGETISIRYIRYTFNWRTITGREERETTITLREYVPDSVQIELN